MWKDYRVAGSVQDALQILDQGHRKARLIAGGSDLFIDVRDGRHGSDCMVDVTRIPGPDAIDADGTYVTVCASATFHALWASPLVGSEGHALAQAAHHVAAWTVQNVATLAGNVVTAQPAGDGSLALRRSWRGSGNRAGCDGRVWVPVQESSPGRVARTSILPGR